MSGNRTWAKRKGWLPAYGYKYGLQAMRRVIDFCLEKKIPYVSLYTFSIENFKRPLDEQNYLFEVLAREEFENLLEEAKQKGVKAQFLGDRSLFPKSLISIIEKIELQTAELKNLTLNFLFCYGSQQEIVHGVKEIVRKIKSGQMQEDEITTQSFSEHLWTKGMPAVDLIIRTDGHKRLSNFLLYQSSYADFYFLDCMWPEIDKTHLEGALHYFNTIKRNFGA